MVSDSSISGNHRAARGFTLVELLVVIGIIVLLIGILLPAVGKAYRQGVKARMVSDLNAISVALDAYKQDRGDYPRVFNKNANGTPNADGTFTGANTLYLALMVGTPIRPGGPAKNAYLPAGQFNTDGVVIQDRYKHAILYYPANKAARIYPGMGGVQDPYIAAASYPDYSTGAPADQGPRPMFNFNDNNVPLYPLKPEPWLTDSGNGATIVAFRKWMGSSTGSYALQTGDTPAWTGPYLLLSPGPDEKYDTFDDDAVNFAR